MNFSILRNHIYALGEELIQCNEKCEGIQCCREKGIVPRGMILEEGVNGDGADGCIVSGINPGIAKYWETGEYTKHEISYKRSTILWEERIKNVSYYKKLREFIRDIGYLGPILWTDLAKCQSTGHQQYPPLETFRRCCKKFLSREIAILPEIEKWDIVAVGREPYTALSYLYPNRTIIGITHPASFGDFRKISRKKLFLKNERTKFKSKTVWLKDLL